MTLRPVPPKSLPAAIDYLLAGGRLLVPTYTRCTIITASTLAAWDAAGVEFLRESGDGYRMAVGRSSVYLLPGTLCYEVA